MKDSMENPVQNKVLAEFVPEGVVIDQKGTVKKEDKVDVRKRIRDIEKEIERIKISDSKMQYAEAYNIPKEAIVGDVSHAGLSIKEREEKIKELKNTIPSNKHWWQKAAVVSGMFIASLFSPKETSGQNNQPELKPDIEVQKHTKESSVEDYFKYVDYLIEKNKIDSISPDEMDVFVEKWMAMTPSEHAEVSEKDSVVKKMLHDIYSKHSPYSLTGKKPPFNLVPGYDIGLGYDKEDRILINKILTEMNLDSSKLSEFRKDNFGYGEVLTDYSYYSTSEIGDKLVKIHFTHHGLELSFDFYIKDKNKKLISAFICGNNSISRSVGSVDRTKFNKELDKLIQIKE